jgi:hypothetical protein
MLPLQSDDLALRPLDVLLDRINLPRSVLHLRLVALQQLLESLDSLVGGRWRSGRKRGNE